MTEIKKIHLYLNIEDEVLSKFKRYYPAHGFMTKFIRACIIAQVQRAEIQADALLSNTEIDKLNEDGK